MKTPLPTALPALPALAALAILALLPVASAHVTVTVEAPTEPIPALAATQVPVTISANCAVVLAEYESAGNTELHLELGNATPGYIGFAGDTIPFTTDMCDPAAPFEVRSTGMIAITPGPLAPAFTDIPLVAGATGEAGAGEFTIQVGYAWSAKVLSANLTAGQAGILVLEVAANADTILKLSAEGADVPAEVEVASPLLAGNATRRVEVPVNASRGGPMELTVSAVAKGKPATGSPVTLTATVLPGLNHTAEHEDAEHEHDEGKDAPAPAGVLVGLALLAFALRRR